MNVKIYRLKLFYVNVSICENLIFLIYRTKISPLIIGEVIPSVYKEDTKISPMINGELILSVYKEGTKISPMISGDVILSV